MKNHSQRGSAIVLLLIAVALFAAVAYAFTQGSRNNTSMITAEQAKAKAVQLIEYANEVQTAAKRLRLRGCQDTQISVENGSGHYINPNSPSDLRCNIFSVNGGGVNPKINPDWFETAPDSWTPWFNVDMAIQDVGTPKPELVMWLAGIKPEICTQVNQMLGMSGTSADPLTLTTAVYIGTYPDPANDTIGDIPGSPYRGKFYACWNNSFFIAILPR